MCGVIGIINSESNEFNHEVILSSIHHRGKQKSSFISFSNNFLGHTLLKTTDASSSNSLQPMISKNTGNIIVFNGEIFNYKELKKLSCFNNTTFNSNTDTEVILYLYEIYGKSFLSYLEGDFAIILYDKSLNEFLIFRDRLGNKPLFYINYKNTLYVSSEIKALLSVLPKQYTKKINFSHLSNYLIDRNLPVYNESFFQGIFSFKPSHLYRVDTNGDFKNIKKYWNLNFYSEKKNISNIDFHDEFHELFKSSIVKRASCIYDKYTLLLSGGLDSSSILFYLNKFTEKTIQTYSFLEEDSDLENENIKYFSNKFSERSNNFFIRYDDLDYDNLIDQSAKISDVPLQDASLLFSLYVGNQLNQNSDQPVLFTGNAGDEVLFGHLRHVYSYLQRELFNLNINNFNLIKNKYQNYLSGNLAKKIIIESLPINIKNYLKKSILKNNSNKIFNNSFKINNYFEKFSSNKFENSCLNILYNWTMPFISDIEDKFGAFNNVIYRVPFTCHKLLEFSFNADPKIHLQDGFKTLLRKSKEINYGINIQKDNSKRSYPAGLKKYVINNKKKLFETMNDILPNIDFINKKDYLENYSRNYSNGDFGSAFRYFYFCLWYQKKFL